MSSSTTAMLKGMWATVSGDRITPARNAVSVFAAVANRAVFPLSLDHPDTQLAVQFYSDPQNVDAFLNSIFGPLCGLNSDSTYGYLPWILLADKDERLRDAVLNLIGPDSAFGRICTDLSTASPNFYQSLRKNWGDEFGAVLAESENNENNSGGDQNQQQQQVFVTQPIPLSMICYFSTRVLHENTSANLRTKSRLDIPPALLLPLWTTPIVTSKYSSVTTTDQQGAGAGSASGGVTADLTVSSLRVSMLSLLLFRMMRCLVSFGQHRTDRPSAVSEWLSAKLGPITRRAVSKLPRNAQGVVQSVIGMLSRSEPTEHRFHTLETLITNWSQHLLSASVARSMLHRERVLELLVTGSTPSDDNKLLNLCDASEWHSSFLTLLLPSMSHVFSSPMNGEAARNPLNENKHVDLIECAAPVLTQFLSQWSTNLDTCANQQQSLLSSSNSNNNNNNSMRGFGQNNNNNNIMMMNSASSINPQVKQALEKNPRLTVHDVSVPTRSALRVTTGIVRQAFMSLFIARSNGDGSSSSGSSSSSSQAAGSYYYGFLSNETLILEKVTDLWVVIVRCARSLARFTDPQNVGLRQYEATVALLGDFIECCMRAEAAWNKRRAEDPDGDTTGESSSTSKDLSNIMTKVMTLKTIENFSTILMWLVDYSAQNNNNNHSHNMVVSSSTGRPHQFVRECSNALESLQMSQGGNNMMIFDQTNSRNNNNNNSNNSNNNIKSALAICESLDASLNVNALFDFQGESPAGENVPAWKCFMALLGRNSKVTMTTLYKTLKRSLDIDSSSTIDNNNESNHNNNKKKPSSPEVLARLSGVRKQLENTFGSLYGDEFVISANQNRNNLAGSNNNNDNSTNDDEDLKHVFSAARNRRDNEDGDDSSRGQQNASSSKGGRQPQNVRFPYDPRVSALTRSAANKLKSGKYGLNDISQQDSATALRSMKNNSEQIRYNNTSSSSSSRNSLFAFIPSIDEIHLLARIFHKIDVLVSIIISIFLYVLSITVFPIITFATTAVIKNLFPPSRHAEVKRVLTTLFASAQDGVGSSSIYSYFFGNNGNAYKSLPSCSYCSNKLRLATESNPCHVHPHEIGMWWCHRCNVSYCAPICRNTEMTAQFGSIVPATNRIPKNEVTVCAKCFVKMNSSDVQYWEESSRSIFCPSCCCGGVIGGGGGNSNNNNSNNDSIINVITLPIVKITIPVFYFKMLRYLASNYVAVVVVVYYALSFIAWLFGGDDYNSGNATGADGGNYYGGYQSRSGEFTPEYSPKLMFSEDFNQ